MPDSEPCHTDRRVSLVIPVRNEEGSLAALLESIRRQTRAPDGVVLVDGGSTDRTVALARELTAGDPRFRVIEAGPATPGRGRNIGIAAAYHEWIALTDAGIRLEATWLEHLLGVVEQDPQVDVVYGNYEPVTDSFFERCAALAYVPPKVPRHGRRMRGPFIASALIHRGVWESVGGFPDLRAAEDLIFMERVREGGFRIDWAPSATVHWHLQPSLTRTFRKFALYSKHNVWAGRQYDWHYRVAGMYLAALPFLGLATWHTAWWLSVPLAGVIARVAKSIWRRREGRGLTWLLNPLQFTAVGGILLTIDLATFSGWLRASWRHRPFLVGVDEALAAGQAWRVNDGA
jgi:cellulose synthase/poly-beta-1,6-N-acetylglucosamine synthase-like glycosyltransferase